MPSESFTLATFMWIAVGYCNMLLLCVAMPILASFVLDGVVVAVRGKDIKPLLTAAITTVGALIVGGSVWRMAVGTFGVPETFEEGLLTAASYVLPLVVAIVVITVVGPQVPTLLRSRGVAVTSSTASVRRKVSAAVGRRSSSIS